MTELNCNEFVELVTDFLDGALDEDDQARFVDHLSLCDGCTTYLDQIHETTGALADLPVVQTLPAEARDHLLSVFKNS